MSRKCQLSRSLPKQPNKTFSNGSNLRVVSNERVENELIPYVEKMKRCYDFSSYAAVFGKDTATKIASVFAKWLQTYKPGRHVNKNFRDVRDFLNYVEVVSYETFPDVIAKLKACQKPDSLEWQKLVSAYRSSITNHTNNLAKSTINGKCNRLSAFLQQLCVAGITPRAVLPGVRFYMGAVRATKGSAELVRNAGRSATTRTNNNGIRFGTSEAEKSQIADIIEALGQEGIALTAEDPNFAERALQINNARLTDLRKCAQKELLQHWHIFQKGKNLINSCELSYRDDMLPLLEDYIHKFNANSKQFSGSRGHSFTRLFDDKSVDIEVRQGRFLYFLKHRYCGIYPEIPFNRGVHSDWEIVTPLHKRGIKLFGGRQNAIRHLNADFDALMCAHLIILIDTFLNVSTVDDLPCDCLAHCNEPGQYYISGWKGRDGGREKLAAVCDETAKVIRMVLEMTSNYRFIAATGGDSEWRHPLVAVHGSSLDKKLFICRTGRPSFGIGEFKLDNMRWSFDNFLNRHECLKGIPWTFNAIRNSVGQKRFYEGGLDIASAATELGHTKGSRCTTGYVVRRAAKQELEREIRRFQTLFEAACIADISGAAKKLGYTEQELQQMVDEACRSGLGVVCWKLIHQKNSQDNIVATKCTPHEDCPTCDYRRVVPASLPNLVDLFLHHDYLDENKEELQSSNPQRYLNIHLPWLALMKAAIEKIERSNLVRRETINEARAIARELKPMYPPVN